MDSIQKLLEQSQALEALKHDTVQAAKVLTFDDEMHLMLRDDLFGAKVPLNMCDWSLQQTCSKLGPPPFAYIKQCPSWLGAHNLNHWLEALPDNRDWFVRGMGDECRAVLSDRYRAIGITQVLTWTQELIGDTDYTLVRPYMDGNSLHLRIMVYPSFPDDPNYGYGVYVREGEIGNLTFGVTGFIQRHSCTNSIVFDDDTALRVVHVGKFTGEEIRTLYKVHLNAGLKVAVERRDAIARAEAEEVPNFTDVVAQLGKKHGLSQETQDYILMGSEGKETRAGLVHGVSFAAHHLENADDTYRMEALAGSILVSEDSLFGRVMAQNVEV